MVVLLGREVKEIIYVCMGLQGAGLMGFGEGGKKKGKPQVYIKSCILRNISRDSPEDSFQGSHTTIRPQAVYKVQMLTLRPQN